MYQLVFKNASKILGDYIPSIILKQESFIWNNFIIYLFIHKSVNSILTTEYYQLSTSVLSMEEIMMQMLFLVVLYMMKMGLSQKRLLLYLLTSS